MSQIEHVLAHKLAIEMEIRRLVAEFQLEHDVNVHGINCALGTTSSLAETRVRQVLVQVELDVRL